jgi:uncharacterized protein
MLFAVIFTDRADRLAVRQQYLPDHLRWLDAHRDYVLVAGSLRRDPDAAPIGGLWIVEAPSKTHLETLLEGDPFSMHGLRESQTICHWSKAFPDRATLV